MKILSVLLFFFTASIAAAESWDGTNNPANLSDRYQYQLNQLTAQGRVDDAHMPWSDNYWESDWGGISFRWNTVSEAERDPESGIKVNQYRYFEYTPPTQVEVKQMSKSELAKLSPAEKYDILMKRYDYPTVRSERERTGPGYDDWQGICHGWVPAAINHAEPLPTEMDNGDGVIVPFGSSDVKALLSYYYGVPAYEYARGARSVVRTGNSLQYLDVVDSSDSLQLGKIADGTYLYGYESGYEVNVSTLRDASECTTLECFKNFSTYSTVESLNRVGQIGQRPNRRGGVFGGVRGVKDPNAGAFHVVLANQLGLMNHAFIGNINKKIKNTQIWNQPIVGFSSQITSDRGSSRRGRRVDVTTRLTYVTEIAQSWEPVVGTARQRYADMTFSYTLELDSAGNITGGEWKDAQYHPSFAWKHDAIEFKGYFAKLKELYRPRY